MTPGHPAATGEVMITATGCKSGGGEPQANKVACASPTSRKIDAGMRTGALRAAQLNRLQPPGEARRRQIGLPPTRQLSQLKSEFIRHLPVTPWTQSSGKPKTEQLRRKKKTRATQLGRKRAAGASCLQVDSTIWA